MADGPVSEKLDAELPMLPKRGMSLGGYLQLKRGAYRLFLLREISSVFNALYVVILLAMLYEHSHGKPAYDDLVATLWSMPMLVLHVIALGFVVLHTITWFNATGTAIVLRRGEEKLPPWALAVPTYAAWLIATVLVFWLVGAR